MTEWQGIERKEPLMFTWRERIRILFTGRIAMIARVQIYDPNPDRQVDMAFYVDVPEVTSDVYTPEDE